MEFNRQGRQGASRRSWDRLRYITLLFILYTQPLFDLVSKHAINYHAFADDNFNQHYNISARDAIHQSIETHHSCTTDVKSWMTKKAFS